MTDPSKSSRAEGTGDNRLATVGHWREFFSLREKGVYYALIVLVVILAIVTSYLGRANYLSVQNVNNVLYQASLTAIMAVAMTVVLISGNFDLSVASVGALAAAVVITLSDTLGFGPAFGIAMLVSMAVGLFNGVVVQFVGINAFIVTLGSLTAVRGLALIYTEGRSVMSRAPESRDAMMAFETGRIEMAYVTLAIALALLAFGGYRLVRDLGQRRMVLPGPVTMIVVGALLGALVIGNAFSLGVNKPVAYMIAFTAIVWWVLTYTNVGRRLYAVGGNAEAARLSGINVARYKVMAFVFCSATAGFAGILFASRLRSMNSNVMSGMELTVIAAAILGGTSLFGGKGSVVKSVGGALLLFSLTNGFNIANLGANYQGLVEGAVIIIAAAIYTLGGRGGKTAR